MSSSLPQQRTARNTKPVPSPSAPVTPASSSVNQTSSTSVTNLPGRRATTPSSPPPMQQQPPQQQQQQTRARDLLRKHYGLGMGVPMSSGNAMNPMNMGRFFALRSLMTFIFYLVILFDTLDSNAFDAKSYYEQLIMTSSLPTLIKRENDLITGTYLSFFLALLRCGGQRKKHEFN